MCYLFQLEGQGQKLEKKMTGIFQKQHSVTDCTVFKKKIGMPFING